MSTISYHVENPEVSIDQHVRLSSIALGEALSKRAPIYLDMNYWIWMRDPDSHPNPPQAKRLLAMLRQGIRDEKIFCPISHSTFIELLKQSDANSRLTTAEIVDELSLGVAFAEEEVRYSTEIAHLMHFHSGITDLHPLEHLVWTKLSNVLGVLHPSNTAFDEQTEFAIQKAFFDHMCSISLQDMINSLGEQRVPTEGLGSIAQKVNAGNQAHSHVIRSFKQAYAAEVRGVFDVSLDDLPDLIVDIAAKKGTPVNAPNKRQRKETRAHYRELFSRALEQGKERERLRTAHILASLHASLRWDKSRKYKANDIFDYHHAVAALAYCRVFLTEKSMKAIVEQKNLQLPVLYGCSVAANLNDAIDSVSEVLEL